MDSRTNMDTEPHHQWLNEVLAEVGLQQFHSKLTDQLQLTKLSHFDFVTEDDLVQLGLSKPAARRLLAAIKKLKGPNHYHELFMGVGSPSTNIHGATDKSRPALGPLTCLINSQDIQIKEEIGHGVHGFVKKGEWTAPNGRVVEVALKILKKDVMSEPNASFNEFVKEISVMHQLNHPNIIKLYGVVLSSPLMMVTELAPYGNLRDKLRKENGQTPISQLINFGVQITSGMEYLESRRFVHRDLAARNIFISHGKKILIGDMGLMRAIPRQENHYVMSEKTKIPYPWCAPESLKFKQFSSSSDVYMFGVTMWEMFSFGKEPWAGLNLNEILDAISSQKRRLPCPESCPAMVYQTMVQCWNTEPTWRPNFSTLYQYLSTSYPLEVIATQHISEISHKRHEERFSASDWSDSYRSGSLSGQEENGSPGMSKAQTSDRKVLTCHVDDRILVIDGQPEKYWWRGQNQRTYNIGWFPLCATRWLAPKKSTAYISKPLKNSFVHTGHAGIDGRWGSPMFIDQVYLKNPLQPDDLNNLSAKLQRGAAISVNHSSNITPSSKTAKGRSKLSRLFGINDWSPGNPISHSYHKFSNNSSRRTGHNLASDSTGQLKFGPMASKSSPVANNIAQLARSLSGELGHLTPMARPNVHDDEPPLIDLNDADGDCSPRPIQVTSQHSAVNIGGKQKESLIDMDSVGSPQAITEIPQRAASETNLNDLDNYQLSWAGSWNTGTFDGSASDIYSAYYCPQDAINGDSGRAPVRQTNVSLDSGPAARYYSAVAQEDERLANLRGYGILD